jgi:alpha-D-ribose 1-methylphosphonate 5-triphosphate diphosphatase PhnM
MLEGIPAVPKWSQRGVLAARAKGAMQRKPASNLGLSNRGEVAERLNAAVLKTAERDERSEGSNPSLSWIL